MSLEQVVFPQTIQTDETPSPTARPTATGVALEFVEHDPVEGSDVIQPDTRAVLQSGYVTVIFPPVSRARTFQASLSESSVNADACHALTIYTAEGEMERDARLIYPARIVARLDSDMIDALGGPAEIFQAYALGGIMIQVNDATGSGWNALISEFDILEDGSFEITAKVRAIQPIPYCIRLNVDADALALASAQINGSPTPTATPKPTPIPTVAPTPTPVPAAIPNTGDIDMTLLSLLLIVAANIIALSLFITRLLARRAGR